jgi:formiminotetrahydrofolate cyclodeaminase
VCNAWALVTALADHPLSAIVERVASTDPAPGAGPSAAWTSALAAALVEMVSAVALAKEPIDVPGTEGRRARAGKLRVRALALADEDVAAYTQVLAVLRRRGEPGHGDRLREALSRAADPPLAIVELAAELTGMAADAAAQARGGVRGEAMTAAILAEAVVRTGRPLVDLNLAGAPGDPRRARVRELAEVARGNLQRVLGD